MPRVHPMQGWFVPSDPAMREMLREIVSLSSFASSGLSERWTWSSEVASRKVQRGCGRRGRASSRPGASQVLGASEEAGSESR